MHAVVLWSVDGFFSLALSSRSPSWLSAPTVLANRRPPPGVNARWLLGFQFMGDARTLAAGQPS